MSHELHGRDSCYWQKTDDPVWRIDYPAGTPAEEAAELDEEVELLIEPKKIVIEGASKEMVRG